VGLDAKPWRWHRSLMSPERVLSEYNKDMIWIFLICFHVALFCRL